MAIIQIPVSSDLPSYEFKTSLDGEQYTLAFRFNTRADRWMMDIKTGQGEMILAGIPLLAGVDLTSRFQDSRLPQGHMFLLNLVNENESPRRDDLGGNVLLLYQEAA